MATTALGAVGGASNPSSSTEDAVDQYMVGNATQDLWKNATTTAQLNSINSANQNVQADHT
jgi:hypothetical protein